MDNMPHKGLPSQLFDSLNETVQPFEENLTELSPTVSEEIPPLELVLPPSKGQLDIEMLRRHFKDRLANAKDTSDLYQVRNLPSKSPTRNE